MTHSQIVFPPVIHACSGHPPPLYKEDGQVTQNLFEGSLTPQKEESWHMVRASKEVDKGFCSIGMFCSMDWF